MNFQYIHDNNVNDNIIIIIYYNTVGTGINNKNTWTFRNHELILSMNFSRNNEKSFAEKQIWFSCIYNKHIFVILYYYTEIDWYSCQIKRKKNGWKHKNVDILSTEREREWQLLKKSSGKITHKRLNSSLNLINKSY